MRNDYGKKRVIIVGAGRTGLALTSYFQRRGAEVTLSDRRSEGQLAEAAELRARGICLDLGGHTPGLFAAADLVAVSPGVPLSLPAVKAALEAGVPVLGEIEFAYSELEAPLVAVTGTNGKSTTTALIGEIFRAWGRRTFVGGNIGVPLIEAADETDLEWVVAELSSFQLEAIERFRPRYALLLNLSEDHLDRYPDMDAYLAAKARIFENMTTGDVAVLNGDDPQVTELAAGCRARRVHFSSRRALSEGIWLAGGQICWRLSGREGAFALSELRLSGLHNIENVMAALVPPLIEGCPPEQAWRAACAFGGLEHRMNLVRVLDGVRYFNDSKGTNVGSVVKSLAGLDAPVTLIAGGKDKGGDYAPLRPVVKEKVARLVLIGEAACRMERELGDLVPTERADSLEDAVLRAREATPVGGSVLLSPGCSSFDMFSGFEERGERFCAAVLDLDGKEAV